MTKKLIRLALIFGLLVSCVQVSAAKTEVQSRTFIPLKVIENAKYMQQVESELEITKQEYKTLSSSISQNKKRLREIRNEIVSLRDQLNNMDYMAAETEKKVMNVIKQITQKKNDMQILSEHIDEKNTILDDQVELLKEYAKFLYVQEQEHIDPVRVLLADASVGEILREKGYFEILNEYGLQLASNLKDVSFELDQNKKALIVKSARLAELKEKLAEEQRTMSDQKEAKLNLLEATRGEEEVYLELLAESMFQQDNVLKEINVLRDNVSFLADKFEEYGSEFDSENYRGLINKRSRDVFEYQADHAKDGALNFKWPVSPMRGLSAYFLDSSYKATFGIPHYAVDIPVLQRTEVRAPEDGIVYRTKDNGIGYSYIILAHRNGFMTVYGHIYEIEVREGETVHQGDVIGLSGGMPGTKGAGFMTTGPHLHFEILKNGNHVDPLEHLPLIQLPFDSLPDKYQEKLKGKKVKVQQSSAKPLTEEDLEKLVESEGKYGYDEKLDIDVSEFIEFEESSEEFLTP
ncbi:MAG: peptidoglycan DD-metalloendopeptidase family protein [Patescibacteria group bacterium]